ncbi:MAG: hypothetical protein V3U16_06555 [Candidatus Neomarinimicrobiota bacterium]
MLAVGFNSSPVAAASMEHHNKDGQPEILITRLNISLSDRLSNQPLHVCPVHGRIMKGAFCKMKIDFFNDPDSASKDKEECFISIDDVSHPSGAVTDVLHLDYKFAVSTIPDMALILPCCIFTCSEFKDYSQSYFNPPDKPPKLLS